MPPRNKLIPIAAALLAAAPLAAQAPAAAAPAPVAAGPAATTGVDVYRREVFRYQRGGRPDPFQALLTAADLGFRVEDLRLTSIVYSPNAQLSLAVFAEANGAKRHRMKVGQRLGTMTVVRIYPQRVDVRIDEFGGSRTQTVQLQRAERRAEVTGEEAPAAAQSQQIPVTLSPAQPAQERLRPLRRGGAAQPQGTAAPAPAAPAPRSTTNPRSPTYTRPRP
ncbi:MAG TPA: hypothetical protein VFR81_26140 [Longimicrobium sp.]|nr:hypothetical protein [Longimicrobium sp.]